MKKILAMCLTAALCLTLFAGCGGGQDKKVEYQDVYRNTFSGQIKTLNPYALSGTSDYSYIANLIDGLVETDKYGRYVPALAESWDMNADATVWTFHLRQGLKWVDSSGNETEYEVTAQNFIDSLRYVSDPNNGAKNFSTIRSVIAGLEDYYYGLVDVDEGTDTTRTRQQVLDTFDQTVGVKAADKYTLEYTLTGPTPYFLSYTLLELLLPVEQQLLDKVGQDFGTGKDKLLYCGSYYISQWDRDKLVLLTKNEHYWDKEHVNIKSLSFESLSDSVSKIEMFQRGNIDDVKLGTDELGGLMSSEWSQYIYLADKTATTYWYTFNFESKNPEFQTFIQNENFRKAIYHAIDRITLSAIWEPKNPDFFVRKTLLPEGAMFDANGKDYTDYGGLAEYKNSDPFQKDKAREYMDQAIAELCQPDGTITGVTPGKVDMLPIEEWDCDGKLPVDILYSSSSSAEEMKKSLLVKEMLETYLGKENVNVILGYANNDFNDEVWTLANWDLVDDSYGFRYADPSANLARITTDGTLNDSQYKVPEFDAMIAEALKKFETNERFEAFAKAETWMLDHAMIIPFMTGGGSYRMTRIVPYTTPGGMFGMSSYKYKGALIQHTPVTAKQKAELEEAYKAEIAQMAKS